ncbi:MAG: hypothetical protein M9952_01695 [Microthrixaceae bacterium]|nr:hypothetical protein [Microthrixaceae bacterium]
MPTGAVVVVAAGRLVVVGEFLRGAVVEDVLDGGSRGVVTSGSVAGTLGDGWVVVVVVVEVVVGVVVARGSDGGGATSLGAAMSAFRALWA